MAANGDGVPAHASYSSIDSWQQCGLKYKLTRIDKHPEEPAWWSVGGSAVHKASEWVDLGTSTTGAGDAADLFGKAFDLEVAEAVRFNPDSPPDTWRSSRGQNRKWWEDNGPGLVQAWIDWRHATGWQILDVSVGTGEYAEFLEGGVYQVRKEVMQHIPGVELPVNVELGGLPVKGYIDRVFVTPAGEVVIVDLKTGARKPSSALQLGFYRAAVMEQYGVTADLGGYWMARKKPEEQLEVQGLQRYTPEFVARFVAGFKKARDMNLYLPHVTDFCKSCGVARHCWAVN